MAEAAPTRTLAGRELPAPGTYEIDPVHTSVEFVVRHLMVAKVRGRFAGFSGTVHIDEVPEESSVAGVIDATSIDTGQPDRDEHLRSADFLEVERFPELRFASTRVETGAETWTVTGDLTIRGVTRPVELDVEFVGGVIDPWGGQRLGFSASTEIDREDFGLTWNQPLEAGGFVVGKKVRIELEAEAVRT